MGFPVAIAAAVIVGLAIGYAASDQDTVEASVRTVTVTITEPAVPTGPLQSGSTGATGFDRCD
jgi:hypothetical protein